jgi:hypothetical protein
LHRGWQRLEWCRKRGFSNANDSELEQTGGVVSDLERRKREESKPGGGNGYLYLTLGVGFVVAAIMVIATAGVPAAGVGFVIPAAIFLGLALKDFQKHRHVLPQPANKERELLSAIKANGGSITPAVAAMETSLTVREADGMLSELAGGGHLAVESRDGALFYSLPGRRSPELEGR